MVPGRWKFAIYGLLIMDLSSIGHLRLHFTMKVVTVKETFLMNVVFVEVQEFLLKIVTVKETNLT